MSTNHSVGRFTATQENDRSAATHKSDRSPVTQKVDRSAATPKKDRSGLCAFTFADGRQCRTPRRSGHSHLCAFHAQKEAQSQAAKQAGEDISSFFFGNYLSACDLSAALAGFSQLSRRVTSSPRPPRPSPISVRPSTNPSNSPGTNTPTSSVELTGAERSPRASNRRHLIPSPFPNQPHPSNRHLLQPRARPPTQTLPTLLSIIRKVFLQERARPSRPLYL